MSKKKPVTYGKLIAAIRKLKYVPDPKRSIPEYSVFHRRGRHLPIFLPVLEDQEPMREIYVITVRRILEENNEDDAEMFDELIKDQPQRRTKRVSVS